MDGPLICVQIAYAIFILAASSGRSIYPVPRTLPWGLLRLSEMSPQNISIRLDIETPIFNASCPWASTFENLEGLYHESCRAGAVTTRTSLMNGFPDDSRIHQHLYFDPSDVLYGPYISNAERHGQGDPSRKASTLNTYGYSPFPLEKYLEWIVTLHNKYLPFQRAAELHKVWIISITGSSDDVYQCCALIHTRLRTELEHLPMNELPKVAIEVNLSCPNIADKPPPAYTSEYLLEYLKSLERASSFLHRYREPIAIGLKLPPYTYIDQFRLVIEALRQFPNAISFLSCCNTLGSSLLIGNGFEAGATGTALLNSESGFGIGGLAGVSIHPLALGNVSTFRRLLDEYEELQHVDIIGIGGVDDAEGVKRMKAAGARFVACASALGRYGPGVFDRMLDCK